MKIRKNIAVNDTGFVFDSSTGKPFTVNEVGLEIIKLMQEGLSSD